MIKFFRIFLLVLIINPLVAQKSEVMWAGTLISANKMIYPFKVEMILKGANISGELHTFSNNYFAKTQVIGKKESNKIEFRETFLLAISDSSLLPNMCYITFNGDEIIQAGKKIIEGKYIAKYSNKSFCDSGTFIMTSAIPKILVDKVIKSATPILNSAPVHAKLDVNQTLSKSELANIPIFNSQVELEFWDGGVEDNDSLQVIEMPNRIYKSIGLVRKPKSMIVTVPKTSSKTIGIRALNVGKLPPNTALLKVKSDGKVIREFKTFLSAKDTTFLYFIHQ